MFVCLHVFFYHVSVLNWIGLIRQHPIYDDDDDDEYNNNNNNNNNYAAQQL